MRGRGGGGRGGTRKKGHEEWGRSRDSMEQEGVGREKTGGVGGSVTVNRCNTGMLLPAVLLS